MTKKYFHRYCDYNEFHFYWKKNDFLLGSAPNKHVCLVFGGYDLKVCESIFNNGVLQHIDLDITVGHVGISTIFQ